MSEPIIIRTPAPDTEERLVLVPPDAVSRTEGGELLTIRTANARDATPADLERAGWVKREVPSAEAWKAAHAEAERELIRARAALSERAGDAERERDEAKELARVLEVERDDLLEGDMREARTQRERADTAEAERDTLRAEVERLTAPGEGEPTDEELRAMLHGGEGNLSDGYRRRAEESLAERERARKLIEEKGLERARQQPAKDRATDEELRGVYAAAFAKAWAHDGCQSPSLGENAGILAVAAHVRQECLVAQAVGMMPGVRSLTIWHEGPGANTVGVRVNDIKAIMQAPTDVPATLARLLGEVSR